MHTFFFFTFFFFLFFLHFFRYFFNIPSASAASCVWLNTALINLEAYFVLCNETKSLVLTKFYCFLQFSCYLLVFTILFNIFNVKCMQNNFIFKFGEFYCPSKEAIRRSVFYRQSIRKVGILNVAFSRIHFLLVWFLHGFWLYDFFFTNFAFDTER